MTSNPLDDLRKINREQRGDADAPVLTALREAVSTDGREDASKEARQDVLPQVRQAGSASASEAGSTSGSTGGRKEVRKATPAPVQPVAPADLRQAVRDTVNIKRVYQGGVKATIDLSPELSTRFKRYSIDHSNVTMRQLLTELLDKYLEGEGY